MKTDSNKKLARRRDAAAVTESLALSEMVELYIFSQRCFLLINPPCVPVTALLSICRLFTRLTSFCDSITAVEQTSWQVDSTRVRQAERATTTAGLSSVTAVLLGLVFMSVSLSEKPRKFGCEQLRNIILGKHIFPTRLRVTNTGEATV